MQPASPIGGNFELIDHHGREFRSSEHKGQFLLIFFGFTHCRVVCPEKLSLITEVLGRLGSLSNRILPLYITVDPERDSADVMVRFLSERFPRFIGLTGDRESLEKVRSQFKAYAERALYDDEAGGYDVPHTAAIYLIDPKGDYRAHFLDGTSAAELEAALRAELLSWVND